MGLCVSGVAALAVGPWEPAVSSVVSAGSARQ